MQIPEMIENIDIEFCHKCRVHHTKEALRKLTEDPVPDAEQAQAKPIKAEQSRTVKKSLKAQPAINNPRGEKKPMKMPRTMKRLAHVDQMRNKIAAYLAKHPGSSTKEIAAHVGETVSTTRYNMVAMGLVRKGSTSNSVWFLADQKRLAAPAPADPIDDEEDDNDIHTLECAKCGELFADRERLERHVQLVHKKGAA